MQTHKCMIVFQYTSNISEQSPNFFLSQTRFVLGDKRLCNWHHIIIKNSKHQSR